MRSMHSTSEDQNWPSAPLPALSTNFTFSPLSALRTLHRSPSTLYLLPSTG